MAHAATPAAEERWRFEEGEELAPGRSALKRLGGGRRATELNGRRVASLRWVPADFRPRAGFDLRP